MDLDRREHDTSRLACPFSERNPCRYKNRRACNGKGFPTLFRLKEHIRNVHGPICPTKDCQFRFEKLLDKPNPTHLATCTYTDDKSIEHLTTDKMEEVERIPKQPRGGKPHNQWRLIYNTIFAGYALPAAIPAAPYRPTLEQCLRVSEKPPEKLLETVQTQARRIVSPQQISYPTDSKTLRFYYRILIPPLITLVREEGPSLGVEVLPQHIEPALGPEIQASMTNADFPVVSLTREIILSPATEETSFDLDEFLNYDDDALDGTQDTLSMRNKGK